MDSLDRAYYDFCLQTGRPYFGPVLRACQGLPARHNYMQLLVEAEHQRQPEKPLRILEVGSWAGGSAITWADAVRRCCGDQGRVVCVDPWKPYFDPETLGNTVPVYLEMRDALESGEILTLFLHNIAASGHADIVIPMRGASKEVLPLLADQAFDIVFIDGDHTHPSAQEDLQAAVRLIRDGGILCGDDLELGLEAVDPVHHQASLHLDYVLDPRMRTRYHPGVTQAVAEVCGDVSVWQGFWAMRRQGGQWGKVILPALEPHKMVTVPHLAEPDAAAKAAFNAWQQPEKDSLAQAELSATVTELNAQNISIDQAIDRLLKSLSMSAMIAPAVCVVGEMLCSQGAALASVRLFEGLVQACPDEAIYHTRYGEALFAAGCIANARTAFLRALELAPEKAEIQNNMGVACWELGDQQQALRYVETAHRLDPGYADAEANLTAMRSALAAAA